MEQFYIDVNLSRWAIIQYSSHIWKRPKLKKHLKAISKGHHCYEKHLMPIELHDEVDQLILPNSLKNELKLAIGSMGTRIRSFLLQFKWNTESTHYIDHIQWNYVGCVDYVRTIKALYKSAILPINYDTWLHLCWYCVEECITDFWQKISKNNDYGQLMEKICTSEDRRNYLIIYWGLRMQNDLATFKGRVDEFDESETVDEFMFRQSHYEYSQTFVYFWNRLNEEQRISMMAKMALSHRDLDQDIDYFMFMSKQYLIHGYQEVILKMLTSTESLVKILIWPYQDMFIPAIELTYASGYKIVWICITAHLLNFCNIEKTFTGDGLRAKKIFYHLWSHKSVYGFEEYTSVCSVELICKLKDMELLKYVVSNTTSWEEREKFWHVIKKCIPHLGLKFLKEFIREVSSEIDGKEWFELKLAEENIVIKNFWKSEDKKWWKVLFRKLE